DSATADTAFKNFEPAFISPITSVSLIPGSGRTRFRSRVSFYPLLTYKQGRSLISVYFIGKRDPFATTALKHRK
ncbi:hypothetical protein ACC771_23935, partial [Rhizobium ruizarguesonis]